MVFIGANLSKADLIGAHLRGADFRQVDDLTLKQVLTAVVWDKQTKFPPWIEKQLVRRQERERDLFKRKKKGKSK